ncbi:MAG TPA: hypothetical protein VK859_16125, partial [bacterium]|nr:hypothetical protein [bacterium]
DVKSGMVYVVGKITKQPIPRPGKDPHNPWTWDALKGVEYHLVAFNLRTGKVVKDVKIEADYPGDGPINKNGRVQFDATFHLQRPGLLIHKNKLYIGFAGHQDTPPWHGWIFSYDCKTLRKTGVWCSTPNGSEGGIWQSGGGLVCGNDGNLYLSTGNGNSAKDAASYPTLLSKNNPSDPSLGNYANMFVKLSPGLKVLGSPYIPIDVTEMNAEDDDLGVSGPFFIPGTNFLVGADKMARIYVLDTEKDLGLQSPQVIQAGLLDTSGLLEMVSHLLTPDIMGLSYHHIHGSPVAWNSQDKGTMIYVWPERDYLRAYHWNSVTKKIDGIGNDLWAFKNPADQSLSLGPYDSVYGQHPLGVAMMPGGILTLSANQGAPGTGIVWASIPDENKDAWVSTVPGILRAFDAESLTSVTKGAIDLWDSGMDFARDGGFMFAKYNPPTVAEGRVYLPSDGEAKPLNISRGQVLIYGLKQWGKYQGWAQKGGKDLVPAEVKTGETFNLAVTFRNVGTTVWRKQDGWLGKGVWKEGGDPGKNDRVVDIENPFALSRDVNPGEEVCLNLTLRAPSLPDKIPQEFFDFQWQMVQGGSGGNKSVEPLGEKTPQVTIFVDR